MRRFSVLLLFLPFLLYSKEIQPVRLENPSLLSIGMGSFDVTRKHPMPEYQIEYRGKNFLKFLRPITGIMWTQKGSVFLYGSVGLEIFLLKKIVFTPSFGPGIYFKGGGKNLHYPLEFRSSVELAYVFDSKARFGAEFYHLSHAGLGGKNPGTECLLFFLSFPIRNHP